MVYKPVQVHDRELVDGGIVSTTNVDIAVEAGAKFVIVVNPLVPYVNDFTRRSRRRSARACATSATWASPQIGYQTFKLLAYQRLHEMARQWEQSYPGVDIVLIEPEPDDELMFQTSIMDFTKRVEIARHGFESVTLKLAEDYDDLPATSAAATASRSPPRACARSSSTSPARRRRRGPGAGSSSRRPARCCASRRPRATTRPTTAVEEGLELDRSGQRVLERPQEAVGRDLVLDRDAHVARVAERPAGADQHALAPQAGGELGAVHRGRRDPEDVRL